MSSTSAPDHAARLKQITDDMAVRWAERVVSINGESAADLAEEQVAAIHLLETRAKLAEIEAERQLNEGKRMELSVMVLSLLEHVLEISEDDDQDPMERLAEIVDGLGDRWLRYHEVYPLGDCSESEAVVARLLELSDASASTGKPSFSSAFFAAAAG